MAHVDCVSLRDADAAEGQLSANFRMPRLPRIRGPTKHINMRVPSMVFSL